MTPAEVVDLSIKVYQRMAGRFIFESIIPAFLTLIGLTFVFEWTFPSLTETSNQSSLPVQIAEFSLNLFISFLVAGPLILVGGGYLVATVVILTAEFLTGRPIDPKSARSHAQRVWKHTVVTSALILLRSLIGIIASAAIMGLGGWLASQTGDARSPIGYFAAFLGIVGILAGGVWFLVCVVKYALAIPVSVLEDADPRTAVNRSSQLQKHSRGTSSGSGPTWYVVITTLLAGLLIQAGAESTQGLIGSQQWVNQLTQILPLGPIWNLTASLVPTFLAIILLLPAIACGITVIYFERRVRLEGYDIDALASNISVPA